MSGALTTAYELVAAEWLKLRSTRTNWMIGLVALGLTLVFSGLLLAFIGADAWAEPDSFTAITIPGAVVGLLTLVIGVLGMAGEFRHGTITYTFLAVPHRARVMVLKLAFYFAIGVLAALVTLVALEVLAAVVLTIRGIPIIYPQGDEWAHCGRLLLTTGLFGAFGVALSALLRSQVLTVTLAMVWLVIEWIVAPLVLQAMDHAEWIIYFPFFVFIQATGLLGIDGGSGDGGVEFLSAGRAQLLGLAYIVIAAVIATLTTMRRDVT
jgi:ABC-2 type transport system permease protein